MKKFTDSNKYKQNWWIDLSSDAKLMYYYLVDKCDLAGFYEIIYRHIQADLAFDKEIADMCFEILNSQLIFSKDKTIIWIKDFPVDQQSNKPLSLSHPPHVTIIRSVARHIPLFDEHCGLADLKVVSKKGANDERSIIVEIHANSELLRLI